MGEPYSIDRLWPANVRVLSFLFFTLLHAGILAAGILQPARMAVPLGRVEVAVSLQGVATSDQAAGSGETQNVATSAKEITQAMEPETPAQETNQSAAQEPPPEQVTAALPNDSIAPPLISLQENIPSSEVVPVPLPLPAKNQSNNSPKHHSKVQKPEKKKKQISSPESRKPAKEGNRRAVRAPGGQGTSPGSSQSGGRSRASYAALVVAQIQAHKYYPAAARGQRISGIVGFSLTIGSGGSVSRFNMTRSSGSAVLDQAARQIVFSIRLPPPPGGIFVGSSSLRFSLER